MKRALLFCFLGALLMRAQDAGRPDEHKPNLDFTKPISFIGPAPINLLGVKRVYIEALVGDGSAEAIRELLMSSLERSHLFLVTENPERADAVLRGAADDKDYVDTFDSQDGITGRASLGGLASSRGATSRSTGANAGVSVGEDDSRHTRERKHEAFATVRLCNRDGDVLWATTQESKGAKFRGASADVADRVVHQLELDIAKTSRAQSTVQQAAPPAPAAKP
jgi:hypothetical protein